MTKTNCWEFKNCERGPGGSKISQFGECPASANEKADSINGGKNGGRACWAIAGTLCGGVVQGHYATKLANCMDCDFFKLVQQEEGRTYIKGAEILRRIQQ